METVVNMATGTDMALTDDIVIDRAVTYMVMVVTNREMVVRRRGVTKISRATGASLNVEKLGIWLKIVRKVVRAAGKNDLFRFCWRVIVRTVKSFKLRLMVVYIWVLVRGCRRMKETTRGTETAIVYNHQKHHHRGLIRELMIKGIVTDMETVVNMETGTDMALTDDIVIDRAVTDMVMVVTDREMVVRRRVPQSYWCFFECGEVGHLAKDCKKGSTSSGEKRFVRVGNKSAIACTTAAVKAGSASLFTRLLRR
nr:hypothetical protein [Tanacetum cinerariifolium]